MKPLTRISRCTWAPPFGTIEHPASVARERCRIVALCMDLRTQLRIVAAALLVVVTLFFIIRLRSERRQRKAKEGSGKGALVLAILIALLALAGFAVYHFGGPEIIHALRRWGR